MDAKIPYFHGIRYILTLGMFAVDESSCLRARILWHEFVYFCYFLGICDLMNNRKKAAIRPHSVLLVNNIHDKLLTSEYPTVPKLIVNSLDLCLDSAQSSTQEANIYNLPKEADKN